MQEYKFKIRAHHGLCICFFRGEGYSSEFVEHMSGVIAELKENPNVLLTDSVDDICQKCPNNEQGVCKTADKVREYDRRVLSYCNLAVGEIIPFAQLQQRVKEYILSPKKRECVCGAGQWSSICCECL